MPGDVLTVPGHVLVLVEPKEGQSRVCHQNVGGRRFVIMDTTKSPRDGLKVWRPGKPVGPKEPYPKKKRR